MQNTQQLNPTELCQQLSIMFSQGNVQGAMDATLLMIKNGQKVDITLQENQQNSNKSINKPNLANISTNFLTSAMNKSLQIEEACEQEIKNAISISHQSQNYYQQQCSPAQSQNVSHHPQDHQQQFSPAQPQNVSHHPLNHQQQFSPEQPQNMSHHPQNHQQQFSPAQPQSVSHHTQNHQQQFSPENVSLHPQNHQQQCSPSQPQIVPHHPQNHQKQFFPDQSQFSEGFYSSEDQSDCQGQQWQQIHQNPQMNNNKAQVSQQTLYQQSNYNQMYNNDNAQGCLQTQGGPLNQQNQQMGSKGGALQYPFQNQQQPQQQVPFQPQQLPQQQNQNHEGNSMPGGPFMTGGQPMNAQVKQEAQSMDIENQQQNQSNQSSSKNEIQLLLEKIEVLKNDVPFKQGEQHEEKDKQKILALLKQKKFVKGKRNTLDEEQMEQISQGVLNFRQALAIAFHLIPEKQKQ